MCGRKLRTSAIISAMRCAYDSITGPREPGIARTMSSSLRRPLQVLVLLTSMIFSHLAAAQYSRDPGVAPCEGDRKRIGEVFWLVCAGREVEARRIIDTQPTAQAMVVDLAAYAAAHMERGNFAIGLAAARELVNLEHTIAASGGVRQSGWSYRSLPDRPWRLWETSHPALRYTLQPTWPIETPPSFDPAPPPPLPAGIWAIQESLLIHPYERIRTELLAWISFAYPDRPAIRRDYYGAIVDAESARERVASYLAHAGNDADAIALLRPVPPPARDSAVREALAAAIIRIFVGIGDPHRALAGLQRAGIPFDPLGNSGEWEVVHLLLRKGDVAGAKALMPLLRQRQRFTWWLAEAYLKRSDQVSALESLKEGFAVAHDDFRDESGHLHFAEAFNRLGDQTSMRVALSAAEKAIPLLAPFKDDQVNRRIFKATGDSLLRFAAYKLRAEPFDQSLAALSDSWARAHFLALCINDAADGGHSEEVRRLIRVIDRIQLPPPRSEAILSTYLGDEARYQAAMRLAALKDEKAARALAADVRRERGRLLAVKDVAEVLTMDPAKVLVRHYVLNSRLSRQYE